MKKLFLLLALVCSFGADAMASTSAMTATITDTDGTPWANATYKAVLQIQGQPGITPTISGVPVFPLTVSGAANSSGVITGTFTDTKSVDQANAVWVFTIQSNTSAAPVVIPVAIFGATPNLTGNFTNITAPRFPANTSSYGYADVEVTNPKLGNSYFNTSTLCSSTGGFRQYSNTGWQCGGGAAGTNASTAVASIDSTNMTLQWLMTEGTGTTVADNSGNGNNGTFITGPTWSGQFINFASNSGGITLPAGVTTFRRLDFGILIPSAQPGGQQSGDFINYGDTPAFPTNPSPFCGTNSTMLCLVASGTLLNSSVTGGWSSNRVSNMFYAYQPSNGSVPLNGISTGWHAVTWLCGSSSDGTYDTIYVDGTKQVMSSQTRACPTGPTGTYTLGGDSHLTGTFYRGQMGYFAVKSATGTDQSIYKDGQAILQFLLAKGAQVGISSRAGYRTPTLVCFGDSRTNGYLSNQPLCTSVAAASSFTSGWSTISYGSNGLTAADAAQEIKTTVASTVPKTGRSVVSPLLGVNDATGTCTSVNWIASELQRMIADIHDLGAQVIIGTEVSANGKDTCLQQETAAIRANWQALKADAMVDYADGVMGATGAYTNLTYYQPDGIHWTVAGTNYNGTLLANVHAELVGSSSTNFYPISTTTYQMLPADGFVRATVAGAATWTLVDCTGFSKRRTIINPTAFAITVNPSTGSQTIDGNASKNLAAGATWTYEPVPNAPGTAGCTWSTVSN